MMQEQEQGEVHVCVGVSVYSVHGPHASGLAHNRETRLLLPPLEQRCQFSTSQILRHDTISP